MAYAESGHELLNRHIKHENQVWVEDTRTLIVNKIRTRTVWLDSCPKRVCVLNECEGRAQIFRTTGHKRIDSENNIFFINQVKR